MQELREEHGHKLCTGVRQTGAGTELAKHEDNADGDYEQP